jgi:hypothetical protein
MPRGSVRSGYGQKTVLMLEPTRAANTVGSVIFGLFAASVVTAALWFQANGFPQSWQDHNFNPSDQTVFIVAAVAGAIALLCVIGAVYNGLRWQTARRVEKLSDDPRFATLFPQPELPPPRTTTAAVPQLDVQFPRPRKVPKIQVKLRRVTSEANIVGHRPLHIVYLRLFENQPRMRTFIQGAWREFGYVHMLRSAAAVTRSEYKSARRSGDVVKIFVRSHEQLDGAIAAVPRQPLPKGRYKFKTLGPVTIRVRDRYGSYPVQAALCHGNFWKEAIDTLLQRVDLAVVDLSGYSEKNAGIRYELQRVVDRIPIERVVVLRDEKSKNKFLENEIRIAWSQMAAESPNAGLAPKQIVVYVTDHFQSSSTQDSSGNQQVHVRLTAQRRACRRVAADAQNRLDRHVATTQPGGAAGTSN